MEGTAVGSWQLEEKIGEGGMGEVYRAVHRELGMPAAVKRLLPILSHDPKLRERFLLEARTQAQLGHRNIVRVLDTFEWEGRWYLVSEYLPGGSLEHLLAATEGPAAVERVIAWARQVLEALNFAHQRGVIHRDVKPSNLLLGDEDGVKITDFGIARVLGAPKLTTAGVSLGTPQYMSPEQIVRPQEVDHRTDVYSVGLVLYELLTGRAVFDGDTDFEVKRAQVNDAPPPLRERNPAVSEALEALVMRALAKEPSQRFQGCGEMSRALAALDGGEGDASAPPDGAHAGDSTPAQGPLPQPDDGGRQQASGGASRAGTWLALLGLTTLGLAISQLASCDRLKAAEGEQLSLRARARAAETQAAAEQNRANTAESQLAAVRELSEAKSWPLIAGDGFASEAVSSAGGWSLTETGSPGWWRGRMAVASGSLTWAATALQGFVSVDCPPHASSRDFYLAVDVRQISCSGDCEYGLALRRDATESQVLFRIRGQSVRVVHHQRAKNQWPKLVDWRRSEAIRLTGRNRLAVIARGPRLRCFVNEQLVADIPNAPANAGFAGISLELSEGKSATVEFDNFELRGPPA